ncbi:hypothetical protein B0H12DRAFT_1125821 [Mycena haematopus]|nr:hypothetical protein B0H12DRAFT_1125821 [Mycena haematopus]
MEGWRVADRTLLWEYVAAMEQTQVLGFNVGETDGGKTLIIMVCGRSSQPTGVLIDFLEMVRLNVQTGTHESLLVAHLGKSDAPGGLFAYPINPIVNGPIAVAEAENDSIIIVDWRARSYCILQCHDDERMKFALIPQHIILMVRLSESGKDKIHLISTDTLGLYWIPIIGTSPVTVECSSVLVDDIPKLSTIQNTNAEQSFSKILAHESPIRDGDYRIWILCSNKGLRSYRLSIPNNGGDPQWFERSWSVDKDYVAKFVSYSGHLYYVQSKILSASPLLETVRDPGVEVDAFGEWVEVSAYSGAMTYFNKTALVIQYFK